MSDTGDFIQLGLTAAGAIVGSFFGQPLLGAQIGFTIGAFFNPTDLGNPQGPRLEDTKVQTSSYGKDIPKIFGKVQVAGNIIWAPDLIEEEVDEDIGTKKGKGGKTTGAATTFRYYANFAVMFCEGPVGAITRMWADDELIYDVTGEGPVKPGNINHRRYMGTSTQDADPLIQSYEGEEHTPAYRFRCYVVFERLPIDRYGRRIPVIRAEIVQSYESVFPGSAIASAPYNVIAGYYPTIDPLRYQIIVTGGGTPARKIDAITKTVVASSSFPYGITDAGFDQGSPTLIVDVFGNVYVQDDQGGHTSGALYRLSPSLVWTGEKAGLSGASVDESQDIPVGAFIRYHPGNFFQFASFCDDNDFVLVDINPYTATGGESATDMSILGRISRQNSASAITTGLPCQDCFVLPDGRIFILYSQDGTTPGSRGNTILQEVELNNPPGAAELYTDVSTAFTLVSTINLTSYISGGEYLMFYPGQNAWLVAQAEKIIKYDIDLGTAVSVLTANLGGPGTFFHGSWNQVGSADQGFWYQASTAWNHISFRTMEIDEAIQALAFPGDIGNILSPVYDPLNDAIWFLEIDDKLYVNYLHRINGGETTLRTVVSALCQSVGYTTNDYQLTSLTDSTVHGYTVGRRMACRNAIEPLTKIYAFDAVESDGKVKWISLGTSTITATLTEDDVGAYQYGGQAVPLYTETRTQDTELPLQISFEFQQIQSYEDGAQTAQRDSSATQTDNLVTFTAPIVLTNDEARQFAEKMLWRAWQQRTAFAFTTNWDFLKLDPIDVINLRVSTVEGTVTHQLRIIEQSIGKNGLIEFKAVSEDAATYAIPSTLQGGTASAAVASAVISVPGPSQLYIIDSPPLNNTDNTEGYYVAVAPILASSTWSGAAVLSSPDMTTWSPVLTTTDAATAGWTETALSSTEHWTTWVDESVTVRLSHGSLSSKTELEVLNGANNAIIGNEVIQFQYASALGGNAYRLSRLLRARKGTEWAVSGHNNGERFIYLGLPKSIKKVNDGNETVRFYTTQTLDWPMFDAPYPFTNTQKRMTPFAPHDLRVGRTGSSLDAHITWQRRNRTGGEWKDGTGTVPRVDDNDYEVEIFSSATSSTVVRTIAVSTQTSTVYTSAMQVTDFGSAQEFITFRVFQMNDTVGRGIPSRRKTL